MTLSWQTPEWCSTRWGCIAAIVLLLLAQKYLRLIERLVSLVLSLRLVSVLNSLGPETVQFSLLKGSVSLHNVHLKPEFVDSLDLPFRCKDAIIKKIEFHMPVLRYGGRKAAVLDISNIEVEAVTRHTPQNQRPEVFEQQRAGANAAQRQAKLSAVEALLWDSRSAPAKKWQPRGFLNRHCAFQMARMLDIQLRDINLHITVDRTLKMEAEPAAPAARGSADAEVIGSVVSFRLRSFTVRNAANDGYGVLSTDIQLHGLSVDVQQGPDRKGATYSIVRRWNVDLKLGWRLASWFFDRVAQRSASPVVNIHIFAHALLFHFNAPALKSTLSLHSHFVYYFRYHQYRKLRPQVAVDENPQQWWQHAGRAVLTERSQTLGSESSRWGLTNRRYYRRLYQLYYLRHRSYFFWLVDVLRGNPHASRDALMHLESELGDGEIAQFRWWAWASQKSRGQVDAREELAEKLEALYRVMGARGKVRQKRSRPLRAQLVFSCPKTAVALETGTPEAPRLFEVALHQLDCTLLAGSQNSRQLQSGAGPISIDASVAAFHVTHSGAGPAVPVAGSSSSAALEEQADMLTPWLMRSPPEASRKEVAPNFLTWKVSQPALRAAEPMQVLLSVAQIDMVYSQYALLRLLAFLNDAYPPPNLDPLMVRASVTLNEIVRERLVGPRRPHQLQKHQQSQLSIQVNAGDIRMMMPCSRSAAASRAAAFGSTATAFSSTAQGDDTGAPAEEGRDPSFLVVVLSSFSVSSQAQEARPSPRITRSSTLGRSGRFERWTSDLSAVPDAGVSAGAARQRPPAASRRSSSQEEVPEAIAVPVSAFSAEPPSAGPEGRSEQEAWMRRRPGATTFEKMQVRVGLEVFLAKPDAGPLDFRDCAQVIDPFTITTSVDHCVEPATLSSYRRILQVMIATSRIRIELSKFVKQELHSLANYMHSNLTNQQVTKTITRHFAAKSTDSMGDRKSVEGGALSHHRLNIGSSVTFGDRRSTIRRVGTATTELSTQQSGEGAGTEDGEEEPAQEVLPESHYGLVLALQVHIPDMAIDLVQVAGLDYGPPDYPDLPSGLFCLVFSDLQATLAIDEDIRDMRFAIGCFGVEDLAEEADVRHIITPTPLIVDEGCNSSRASLQRAFQAWRMQVAQHSTRVRRARDSMHHMLLTSNSQLSGHIINCSEALEVSVESSLLRVALEIGTLRRALLYTCELAEAQPAEAGDSPRACPVSAPPGTSVADAKSKEVAEDKLRKLQTQKRLAVLVHLHGAHFDVILEKQRFASVIASGLELSCKASGKGELYKQVLLQCTSFQVLDRLCASHLYREAIVCEKRGPRAGSCDSVLQLAVVLQNSNHDMPAELQETGCAAEDLPPVKPRSASPTAVQRLAALHTGAAGSVTPGQLHHKKHLHRKKRKVQPQKVIRVECDSVHISVVSRFIYDCAYFSKEVMAMTDAVMGAFKRVDHTRPQLSYRTITEVVMTNLRIDVPRHSWSPEFYSISCSQASMVHPATTGYVEQLKPCMTQPPSQRQLSRAKFEVVEGCCWWEHVPPLLQAQHSGFPGSLGQDTFGHSATSTTFHGVEEHNNKFHHWHQGQDGGVAIQLEEPKLFWCLVRSSMSDLAMRQVLDGGDIVAQFTPSLLDTKVWCPWGRAMFGELQYSLLLGVFWENAFEPCSFGPRQTPLFPYGKPLPPAPPQPPILGVDKSQIPCWKFDIRVHSVHGSAEKLPPPLYALGCGPDLGRVQVQDLQVTVGEWPCGSWDITVASRALLITDTRMLDDAPFLYIVQIGEVEGMLTSTAPRLISKVASGSRTASSSILGETASTGLSGTASRWTTVRRAVREGSGPFAPPKRLARHASFAWDTQRPGTPGSPNIGFFSNRSQSMGTANGGDSPRPDVDEGFFLEYVMQAAVPATAETPALMGPHVVEIVAKGAQLTYPLATMRSFCHDIVETYSHYIYPPWVAPYPQDLSPDQWMYANIVTHNCQLFVPLPDDSPMGSMRQTPVIENGLNFTWSTLRLGQFWGGDNECTTRFNADELSASGHVDGSLHGQGLISPFKAKAELRVRNPKDRDERTSISLDVRSSNFEAQPSFGQMPLFHSAIRLVLASVSSGQMEERLDKTEEFLRAVVFRPSSQRLNVAVESLSVGLVDDRYGHHIKVLAARLQDLDVKCGRDYPHEGMPTETQGMAKMALDIMFLNSAIDATEPMVESWPFSIGFRESNGHRMVTLTSDRRLNLIVTPAAFRSLGDLYSFARLVSRLPDKARRSLPSGLVRGLGKALAISREKMSTLYRITNQSGLKLSYWVESAAGDAHLLRPFQSSDLHVEPVEKSVIMPDSQQHVTARTICMQFEGNWTPVTDIIVDKVGKYAYTIGSPHDTSVTPVVMDVSLDIRTKVLTVHSPFRIENHTNHPLEFNVHLFLSPAIRDTMGALLQAGNAAISTVPASPLAPGAQCYLPVPAVWGGLMYLHAVGWQIGKKDKIDLEGPKLKEKEGLYTCPPVTPGQKPFHCCLKVREELIKVISRDGIASDVLPEYVMCFQPPLVVHNVLPYPISVILADSANQAENSMFTIGVGGFVEVYQFDLSRKIRMSISMQDFHALHSVNIHYPPNNYMDDATRKSVIADLPGLRLAKQITLARQTQPGATSAMFGPQTNRLNLRLHNKMDPGSRAREVVVSCPYWIVNKTNLILRVKDTTLNATQPLTAPPGLGGQADPVLFSTARGGMRVSVQQGAWSRAVNLESLGLHHAFYVLGLPQAVGRASKLAGSAEESIMHFDCERVIAPRGFSPRKNRLVGRLGSMSRLDSMESVVELPEARPEVVDPGHVTRRFNCATGGAVVDADSSMVRRYEFAIETSVGPSIFQRTKVITILPRYVLLNNSDEPLQYGQRGTTLVWQLSPGVRSPFHWDDAEGRFELCVRPAVGRWNWSGAFQIANVGDYGLRVYNPTTRQHCILPVECSLNGASFLVTVGKEAEQPPYRIENRCENVKVRFQQRDIDRDHWENVEPGHSVDYAWEEPMQPHRLCVSLETDGVAFRDASEHEYNLDVIKAFPVVKLRRTNIRIVHKVANTVGRVMTTGINMANKSGGSVLQSQDQPELDARYVYVGVHADGPTRVLCFSETRDEYTRGTSEESVALLTQKLKSLEERNRDVDAQLRSIDEKQNIDMSLVMGAATARAGRQLQDQMDMPSRPSMRLGRMRTLSTDLAAVGSMVSISRAPSLQASARQDLRLQQPHAESQSQSQSEEERPTRGAPNLVRRSLAIIRKVATFPRDGLLSNRESLPAIKEKDAEAAESDSKPASPTSSVANGSHTQESPFAEAAYKGNLPEPAVSAHASKTEAPGSPWAGREEREGSLTAGAFGQQSLSAQRHLSRFGRSQLGVSQSAGSSPEEAGARPRRASSPQRVSHPSSGVPHLRLRPALASESSPAEIQPIASSSSAVPDEEDARKGSILMGPKLHSRNLSLNIPEDVAIDGPPSPYDTSQPVSSGLAASTLTKLKRLSMMRQPNKPRTIGSGTEFDAMLADSGLTRASLGSLDRTLSSPATAADKEQLDEHGNPILGGELLVKVWDAQGLMETWRKKEEKGDKSPTAQQSTEKLRKLRAMGSTRSDVYCVLRCEGQVKRTALARGHQNPVWKEDIAFKSVQISSDLQVSLYGRSRLGQDAFLGEVVIPLREVESVADAQVPDIRRYILGRRIAKEKVSGEVSLACSWRVTPLDVVTMKVKQQQAEVDHKEEILALLQEKYGIKDTTAAAPPPPPVPPMADSLIVAPSLKSFRVISDQDPDIKRIITYTGRLSVKVIEGKNVVPQHDLLHSFYTLDGYVQVTVNTDAGPVSQNTKIERGNVAPVWNKMLTFSDVALGNTITISLFDHKKLISDVLLGQATLSAIKFRNCKPHYLWLPLKRRVGERELPGGELHLRVQWTSDELERPMEALPSWALDVQLKGVGLSIIEANVLKFPREAMHALFEDIHVDFKFSTMEQSGSFAIYSMQIDNQLLTSSHPVVLSHDAPPPQSVEEIPELGLQHKHSLPPFLEIRWDMLQHNSSIIYLKSVSFTLQDMDLVLEEEFLELMVHLFRNLPMGDIWQTDVHPSQSSSGDQEAEILQHLQEVLDAAMIRSAAGAKRVGKKWYFENMDIQGIKCNLTLIPKARNSDELGAQRARLTTAFGIHFMDINNVSLRINALQMRNAFLTWRTLVTQIYRHLFFQALHEVHKILGQVDILGSPIVLGSSIIAGVSTFFKEPAKARTPKQFARGIGKGSLALVKFSAFGFLEAIGQLAGGVSKGLALATMDQEYVNRFSFRSVTLRQRLLQGVQAAGVGIYEGVLGVLREPINGWEDDGMRGIVVGVYMGSSGLVLKPVSGLLEFFSRSIGGVGEAIRAFGDEVTRVPKTRIRTPRQFIGTGAGTGELYNVSWKQSMMARLRKGRFAEDEILDYLQNKDNKALLFTNRHLIYINLKRQQVRWSFSLDNLTSVSTSGLLVLLHHDLTMQVPLPVHNMLRVPVRKRVQCRTRDLHQSLLVKLNRAQTQPQCPQRPSTPPKPLQADFSMDVGNLHILNTCLLPESPGPVDTAMQPMRSSSLSRGLTRVLSGLKEALPSSRSSPPAPNPAAPAEASVERPMTSETAPGPSGSKDDEKVEIEEIEEIQPLPERSQKAGKDGLNSRPLSPAAEHALACLQAIRLLSQAATRKGVDTEAALAHMRTVAVLSKTCLQGADGLSEEAKTTLASIEDLSKEASEASLKESGKRLLRTLSLLCKTAEKALGAA